MPVELFSMSGMKKKLFIILLFLSTMATFQGQTIPDVPYEILLRELPGTRNDSLKVQKLFRMAFLQFDEFDNIGLADSLSEVAIRIAEAGHRPELILFAYEKYLESNDLDKNYQKALNFALKAEQIASILNMPNADYIASKNIAEVYLAGYQYDKALEYSYKSLSMASIAENAHYKTESYLNIGRSLEGKNQKIEAFRNFISASTLAEKELNTGLMLKSYDRLSGFYNYNKFFTKATRYKLKQRELVLKQKPVDSVALMWIEYDLQVIDINSDNNRLNEANFKSVLDFARRNNHRRLFNYEVALYRTHLIEAEKIGLLKELYQTQLPGELDRLVLENPGLFYRLKALFCELDHQPDSSMLYYKKAEQIMVANPNIILKSKFYFRFGEFLQRHGYADLAVERIKQSYDLASQVSYFDYMSIASGKLESLFAESKNFPEAYKYALLNKVLADSMNSNSKKDQLLMMEIDHETRQRERVAEQEHDEKLRRYSLQYTAITIGILTVFVILIMLGSLKVPEWIIRMLGFFSFIFLFEFIILLADNKIHDVTHGEPWKILIIKIFLIAILLPLHHGIEKRVITYLLNHKLLNLSDFSLVTNFWRKMRNKTKEKKQ